MDEAAAMIDRFAGDIGSVNDAVRSAFKALSELVDGLGQMQVGASGLTDATGHIMGVSERSKDGVRGVAERMGSSSESVAAMHQKSRELSDSMDRVAESFALVEEAIRGIREIGERSVSGLDALERELARLDAD